jgi:hypothetical protein
MAYSVFDKYRIVLLASEGCLNRDHVDLLFLNPTSRSRLNILKLALQLNIIYVTLTTKVFWPR